MTIIKAGFVPRSRKSVQWACRCAQSMKREAWQPQQSTRLSLPMWIIDDCVYNLNLRWTLRPLLLTKDLCEQRRFSNSRFHLWCIYLRNFRIGFSHGNLCLDITKPLTSLMFLPKFRCTMTSLILAWAKPKTFSFSERRKHHWDVATPNFCSPRVKNLYTQLRHAWAMKLLLHFMNTYCASPLCMYAAVASYAGTAITKLQTCLLTWVIYNYIRNAGSLSYWLLCYYVWSFKERLGWLRYR